MKQVLRSLRACFKISRRPAARDFGRGQGGESRASPQRAVRNEPTPATGKRPAARRVFGQKAAWLRPARECHRSCSVVAAPRHPAFCPKTGPLLILKQALKPLACPFIRSTFLRIQRARPKSRFVRASLDPTACALIRAGPIFLVGFGLIWSDSVGFWLDWP